MSLVGQLEVMNLCFLIELHQFLDPKQQTESLGPRNGSLLDLIRPFFGLASDMRYICPFLIQVDEKRPQFRRLFRV